MVVVCPTAVRTGFGHRRRSTRSPMFVLMRSDSASTTNLTRPLPVGPLVVFVELPEHRAEEVDTDRERGRG